MCICKTKPFKLDMSRLGGQEIRAVGLTEPPSTQLTEQKVVGHLCAPSHKSIPKISLPLPRPHQPVRAKGIFRLLGANFGAKIPVALAPSRARPCPTLERVEAEPSAGGGQLVSEAFAPRLAPKSRKLFWLIASRLGGEESQSAVLSEPPSTYLT